VYTEVGRGGRLGGCWKYSSSVCLSVLRVRSAHPGTKKISHGGHGVHGGWKRR